MVLFSCTKIPQAVSLDSLGNLVRQAFGNPNNEIIINEIEKRKNSDSAKESLAALVLLSGLLLESGMSDDDIRTLKFKRAENGKPYFVASPISFSISHSRGYIACAISTEGDVGIDIEASTPDDLRVNRIARRFFTEEEFLRVTKNTDEFTREWTRKEAAVKMLGLTLAEYFEAKKRGEFDKNDNTLYFECAVDNHPLTVCTNKTPCEIRQITAFFDRT